MQQTEQQPLFVDALPQSNLQLVWGLMTYAARAQPSIVPITLLGILSSILELAAMFSIIPLSMLTSGNGLPMHSRLARMVGSLGFSANAKFFLAVFLALFILRIMSHIATQVLMSRTMHRLMAHLSTSAYSTFVHSLSFQEVHTQQIGHFVALAGDEASRGAQIVVGIMKFIPLIFLLLAYAGAFFYQSWIMCVCIIAIFALMALSLIRLFRQTLELGKRRQEQSRMAGTHFIESLNGLRTVRGFTAENFVTERYSNMMKDYSWTLFLGESFSHLGQLPILVLLAVALAGVLFFGTNADLLPSMPFIIAGLVVFMRLLPIINQGIENVINLIGNLKAGRNIADMLTAAKAAGDTQVESSLGYTNRIRHIMFDDVCFRYSPETPAVLEHFTQEFVAGKSYAITGPSGAGKSSLVDLLLKFYLLDSGKIAVNGTSISALAATELRDRIILSEQVVRIFYGTIRENILFGRPNDRESVDLSLDLLGLNAMVDSLPAGVETILNYQGSNLSGGQRQRVGIARALARAADVLILDESTNALDTRMRDHIVTSLLNTYSDRILIFVTHDPQVIRMVDEVVNLQPSHLTRPDTASTLAEAAAAVVN